MSKIQRETPPRHSGRRRSTTESIKFYFICFLLYAFIGWVYEVFLEVVVYRWGYSDRGVLYGPWCPVYGFGAMAFILCFHGLMSKKKPVWLRILKPLFIFLGCMVVATAIELATSYILETLTGSWPWQTYANYDLNFEGRIALSPSIRFGLGGTFFLYVLQPAFEWLLGQLAKPVFNRLFWVGLIMFVADCCVTFII